MISAWNEITDQSCAVTQVEQKCRCIQMQLHCKEARSTSRYRTTARRLSWRSLAGLRNRYAARYSRESLLSKHEEAGALRVNVNRQGKARSASGKNGAVEVHAAGLSFFQRPCRKTNSFASLEREEKEEENIVDRRGAYLSTRSKKVTKEECVLWCSSFL